MQITINTTLEDIITLIPLLFELNKIYVFVHMYLKF